MRVLVYLRHTLNPDTGREIDGMHNARDVWLKLKDLYCEGTTPVYLSVGRS